MSISKRADLGASSGGRIDMELFFEAKQNAFDKHENPKGKIVLNVAENQVMSSVIRQKVESILSNNPIPKWTLKYTQPQGHPEVLESISQYLSHYYQLSLDPEHFAMSAGAAASLEVMAYCLGDDGDTIVIPAPAYPMYSQDLGLKAGLKRYDLHTHDGISNIDSAALVTPDILSDTKEKLESQGERFQILLLTSPDNPTGSIYNKEQFEEISSWCIENHVHMVVNEIYNLSKYDSSNRVTFLQLIESKKSPYLHWIYALSKDFCISGFRVGLFYSKNEKALAAAGSYAIPQMCSNLVQHVVKSLFDDVEFMDEYVLTNQKKLHSNLSLLLNLLDKHKIDYITPKGGLFVWCDLHRYLQEDSQEGEMRLWKQIFDEAGLLITPGKGFNHKGYGKFRIVFAAATDEELHEAIDRLDHFFQNNS